MAEKIAADHHRDKKKNKRSQLRKFYDEVVRLESLTPKEASNGDDTDWGHLLPTVHLLTAKAAYANGRGLISNNFLSFIRTGIEQIEGPRDLTAFKQFFEAFMGFYRLHGPNS